MDNSNPEQNETTMSEDIAQFFQPSGSVRIDLGNGAYRAKTLINRVRGLFDEARVHVQELETLFDQQDSRATVLMLKIDHLERVEPKSNSGSPDFNRMCLENVGRVEDDGSAANEGEL
jgi:hypothetical protein